MKLYQLAFAYWAYNGLTTFDSSYLTFLNATSGKLSFSNQSHLKALLTWLNSWGCRQFALAYHQQASESIRSWAEKWEPVLPDRSATLTRLSEEYIKVASEAYVDLSQRVASEKIRNGERSKVRVGPAGAAKILFAARPKVFPAWDEQIRAKLRFDGRQDSYREYLLKAREAVTQLCAEATKIGLTEEDIPQHVGRPTSTLAELFGVYSWVVYTEGCSIPGPDELAKWYQWSKSESP